MFPYSALLHVEIARFTLRLPHYRSVAQDKPQKGIYTERAPTKNQSESKYRHCSSNPPPPLCFAKRSSGGSCITRIHYPAELGLSSPTTIDAGAIPTFRLKSEVGIPTPDVHFVQSGCRDHRGLLFLNLFNRLSRQSISFLIFLSRDTLKIDPFKSPA